MFTRFPSSTWPACAEVAFGLASRQCVPYFSHVLPEQTAHDDCLLLLQTSCAHASCHSGCRATVHQSLRPDAQLAGC
ncbi:hypothetical protein GUJ93_ZPchr0005g16187 [Zizania palustris]|uniref:Uncharacterized protein n=1 Tax=Zizania palustris TaxID=103762 RepID=A0A8J5T5G6_ZIZPA|nr:hypothetical protein GUJ93_ZPchr0005g16187 [Zizania palustris]